MAKTSNVSTHFLESTYFSQKAFFYRCDAMSAIAKREVYKYVKRGNNVTTEEELANALVGNEEEVQNLLVILGKVNNIDREAFEKREVKSIQALNDFTFIPEGFSVQKQSSVGPGKSVKLSNRRQTASLECSIIKPGGVKIPVNEDTPAYLCSPTKSRVIQKPDSLLNPDQEEVEESSDEEMPAEEAPPKVFPCSVELCTKRFLRESDRDKHEFINIHCIPAKTASNKETFMANHFDRHNIANAEKVGAGDSPRYLATVVEDMSECQLPEHLQQVDSNIETPLGQGYALKKQTTGKPFSQKVHEFAMNEYMKGVNNPNDTVRPAEAALRMRDAVDENGVYIFDPDECLDESQFRSLFSRIGAKLRAAEQGRQETEADVEEEMENMTREERFLFRQELHHKFSKTAASELGAIPREEAEVEDNLDSHPIQVAGINVCSLVEAYNANRSVEQFPDIPKLKEIARTIGWNPRQTKKKETFAKKFRVFVEDTCSCQWV